MLREIARVVPVHKRLEVQIKRSVSISTASFNRANMQTLLKTTQDLGNRLTKNANKSLRSRKSRHHIARGT